MKTSQSSILILGASSFLTKPLIKSLEYKNLFKIICQSRSDLRDILTSTMDIKFLEINYEDLEYEIKTFKNCSYIINFVNSALLNQYQILNLLIRIDNKNSLICY